MSRARCVAAAVLALLAAPASAPGLISPTTTIDGPSADVVAVDGVAIAEDGTGGVVYRKRVDGKVHVFAARLAGGRWSAPVRVDVGQRYDSSWPAIGAGDGGRLVVTWTHPFATNIDRLYYAALDPGATRFQRPMVLDPNVGVANYTHPSLAMNRGGQALLAYRVVTNDQPGFALPPGYVDGAIRLARYNGSSFALAGVNVDRDPAQPQRAPTEENAPRVAIALDGSGVVAWQEPDDDFYDRIWARRVFGGSMSVVRPVSPTLHADAPLRAGADAFSLAVSAFGGVVVATRQLPPSEGAADWTRPRIYLNRAPEQFDTKAFEFSGAAAVDGPGPDGPEGTLSAPAAAVATGGLLAVGYGRDGEALLVEGADAGTGAPGPLGEASPVAADPLVGLADSGALSAAWKVEVEGAGGVAVLERTAAGTPLRRLLSAETGGAATDLRLGSSRLGDAAVAFRQGELGTTTVNGALIDAPPGAFTVATPPTWTRAERIVLEWDPSPSGVSRVTYSLLVDDEEVAAGLTGLRHELAADELGDGVHAIRVVASDGAGQQTDSTSADLMIDRTAPRVGFTVARRARTVAVRVSDGAEGESSGLRPESTVVDWGEPAPRRRPARRRGARSSAGAPPALSHRYREPGRYQVRVVVVDEAGNRRRVVRQVRL